ncbi:DUF1217 domain-containing protein [Palleronia pelagia]|uniref:Flagellar basal-body rod protein FlgF n=1 Tax=Palleronia pelagia TaxID=387096 RepID=A0A1H8F2M3_9RHOB|nr:DUF1217 domain-containing protein [Palleronia pelagia]SEN25969.1 Protein of unknown function [Palleronia pelagia]
MISLAGLGTPLAVRLVDSTRPQQLDLIRRDALNARQIEAFEERVGDIRSPADFVEDTEVYTFVMRAFDLEDQIFGKAMIRKMLESDISDPKALVNRLTDPRLRELHQAFAFNPESQLSVKVLSEDWKQGIVDRFAERMLINNADEGSRGAGLVLEFRNRVSKIDNWFDVLKNRDVSEFMRTALGLPKEIVQLDIDKQVSIFKAKFDLEDLKDPEKVDKLVGKFMAIHDALNPVQPASSPTLTLMQGAVNLSNGFAPVLIDIDAIQRMGSASRYR